MLAEAKLMVSKEIAESFPSRKDRVEECARQAAATLTELAAERSRHLSARPALVDMRDTQLGFVELTFQVETAAD